MNMAENDVKVSQIVEDNDGKKKRGRKPKDKIYFGALQEQAVLDYLQSDNSEVRNSIFLRYLEPAFKKMVESLIRGYNLYLPNEDFLDTYNDAISYLLTKLDKFKSSKGSAYSYYSNITKNYLIARRNNYNKELMRNPSFDDETFGEYSNCLKYSDVRDRGSAIAAEEVNLLTQRIRDMVDNPDKNSLSKNEIAIGKALVNLFEYWEYVLPVDEKSKNPSPKLIKSVILLFLREKTGLDTKGIRDGLRKFKKEFLLIKNYVIK